MHNITLYIATSLDGYVADASGDVAWLIPYQMGERNNPDDEDYGYFAFLSTISGVVMGRTTYEQMVSFGTWPYGDKKTYVLTHRPLEDLPDGVTVLKGSPEACLAQIPEQDLWLFGGAEIAGAFEQSNLITTCILTSMPETIGAGIALPFTPAPPKWDKINDITYLNGVTQSTWQARPHMTSVGEN